MSISENIEFLSNLHGVSGYEHNVADEIKKLFDPLCDDCSIDIMGSVIGVKRSKNPMGKVMIEAHIDEVGLIITDIDENGFLYFEGIGGVDARILLAQEVVVHGKNDIFGIIGAKPPHITTAAEKEKTVPIDKLYVDTGYSGEEVRKIVKVSDTITLKNKTLHLLGGKISTKAQDDRTGVAAIIAVLEQLKDTELPFDLYAAACVQEELGLRGGACAAYNIDPDFAIVLDVCHAKSPDASEGVFPMGEGPVLAMGPNIHPILLKAVRKVMDEKEMSYSLNVIPSKTGTDAAATQIAKNGIPTVLFSLPLKYMHTCIETIDPKDVQATADVITEFLKSVTKVGDVVCY